MSIQIDINTPSFFQVTTGLALNFQHFIAAIAVNGFLFLVCLGVLQDRFRRRRRLLALIPRRSMPIIHTGDLAKRQLALVLRQIVRSHHTRVPPPLAASGAFVVATDASLFADSVRASLVAIQLAASRIAAALEPRDSQPLADYVRMLRRHVPALSPATCDAYVALVDALAQPDAEPLTHAEYDDFVTNVHEILRALDHYGDGAATVATARRKPSLPPAASPAPAAAAAALSAGKRKKAKQQRKHDADPDDGVPLKPIASKKKVNALSAT